MSVAATAKAAGTRQEARAIEALAYASEAAQVRASLAEVRAVLATDFETVELRIEELAAGTSAAARAAQWVIEAGGKRLRPLCVLLAARCAPQPLDARAQALVLDVAAAAELVHAATLLHDDVLDEGTTRRGRPAARMVLGNAASVLGGDFLLVRALARLHAHGRDDLVGSLLACIGSMVDGECLQLRLRGRPDAAPSAYLKVLEAKTATLFQWALGGGARAAGAAPRIASALEEFGRCLGLAFQLRDDLLDVVVPPERSGKDPLADLRDGKWTWPLRVAQRLDPAAVAGGVAALEAGDVETAFARIRAAVERTGAAAATDRLIQRWVARGRAAIAALPSPWVRAALEAVAAAIAAPLG